MALNYTSRAEMESCFSFYGLDLRLDDDQTDGEVVNPTEETFLDHCGYEATDLINQFLVSRYEPSAINTNRWVRRTASWMACYILSSRRGNPRQFVARYEEAILHLKDIHDGQRMIFDEDGNPVPSRSDLSPSHSNLTVDDWYWRRKLRVQSTTSSGGTHSKQDIDYLMPWRM